MSILTRFWEDANTDDQAFSALLLDRESILERVDEYSLYCFYLRQAYGNQEFTPLVGHAKYRSPIRPDDEDPSFGIFESTKSKETMFLWKDQAVGITNNIFGLVRMMFRYSTDEEARHRIIKDFNLSEIQVGEGNRIVLSEQPEVIPVDISIASRPFNKKNLDYWSKYNIDRKLLERYNVTALKLYWLFKDSVPYTANTHTYAYRMWNKYKIYQPFADKKYKFRTNYDDKCIEGLLQLEFNQDLLVITKSYKDVMFLRSIGYEAVSPRSENTPILEEYLRKLQKRYKNVVTLFDNDGKSREDFYDVPHIQIPLDTGVKDPTDHCAFYGVANTAQLMYDLLNPYR